MELLQAIHSRCSTRSYDTAPVPKASIETLIAAAAHAPSAMNSQPWAFAVIQDRALLEKINERSKACLLAALTPDSPMNKYREALQAPEHSLFYHAPALVLILSKPAGPCPEPDCRQAAQNLMLAAHGLGLGSCFIGMAYQYLNTPEAKTELGIPQEYTVVAPMIVGQPQGGQLAPPAEKNAPEMLFWK